MEGRPLGPLCNVCKEPSNNGKRGIFYCQTCKDFRCDSEGCDYKSERGIVVSEGRMVCTSYGVMGEPILNNERVVREEDGTKRVVKSTRKKKTEYNRVNTMKDKLLGYNITGEAREGILEEFIKVLIVLDGRGEGKNIGSYDYFIIRLASRQGINLQPLTEEMVEYRKNKGIEKRIEESVRSKYRGLPYNKKRTEEMWDEIHEEIEKVKSGEKDAPEVPKIKPAPVDIKTTGTLNRLDKMVYGKCGVFEALGWEPK